MNLPIAFSDFWQQSATMELTPNQIALYMGLLQIANQNRWQTLTVKVSNKAIKAMLFFDHDMTLIRARTALIKKGFIQFKAGKVNHEYSEYTLISLKKATNGTTSLNEVVSVSTTNTTTNGTTNTTTNGTASFSEPPLPIYDLNKRNEKKNTPLTPQRGGDGFKIFKNRTAGE